MAKDQIKRVNVDLTQEEYAAFKIVADSKDWSDKKMAENIIRGFLKTANKEAILKLGKKDPPRP
jgi:hypothetical protein